MLLAKDGFLESSSDLAFIDALFQEIQQRIDVLINGNTP